VPSYVYSTAAIITTLPWSFKFAFGMLNDCFPIVGYHRKPYMVIGWTCCAAMLLVLFMTDLPKPYWCQDEAGNFITTQETADGSVKAAEPCNPHAAKEGGRYANLMMLAALGYVVADVAADGLTVSFARRECLAKRGQTQTTVYLVRAMGQIVAVSVVGLGMNGPEYNGTFASGLSFNTVMLIFFVPAVIMIPLSWYGVQEEYVGDGPSLKEYMASLWKVLQSKAMFFVVVYQFFTPLVGNISTTAGGAVKKYWAEVQNLQNQLFTLVGLALFAFGLWLVKKHFLDRSWRSMLVFTTVGLNLIDMVFVFRRL